MTVFTMSFFFIQKHIRIEDAFEKLKKNGEELNIFQIKLINQKKWRNDMKS